MAKLAPQNWNMFASSLIIETCKRWGSEAFFVSPGYRDAPFIAALQSRNDLQVFSCWDERAAAYQALGWSKATRKPAVLICTSGTAGANYYPALIEAFVDHVPLLAITADRPFDLIFSGAQQVMDQRDLFGRFVKKSLDFPSPAADLNIAAWISYTKLLLETACRSNAGPVHMNLPFASPLDPVEDKERPDESQVDEAQNQFGRLSINSDYAASPSLSPASVQDLLADCHQAKRGLLIIGRLDTEEEKGAARMLRSRLQWPLFADISSGLKFESDLEILDLNLPATCSLLDRYQPDCVIHLGRRTVSRFFDDGLLRWQPLRYWVFTAEESIQDPGHLPQKRQVFLRAKELIRVFEKRLKLQADARILLDAMNALRQALGEDEREDFHFSSVARAIFAEAPRGSGLFLANSTAIRAFDSWTYALHGKSLQIEANRGVSGIEGLLATTMGLAIATGKAWTLVIGDIALLHDLNSLISLVQSGLPVTVVLVNNGGGRIFETLPLQKHAWVKDPLISTPHSLRFQGIADMAGLSYRLCRTRDEFAEAYKEKLGKAALIECAQDAGADLAYISKLRSRELI